MLGTLFTWMLAGLAGALAHEGAHWLVWRLAGRDPVCDLRELEVRPRAGPARLLAGDRAAAAAPYALALAVGGYGVAVASWPAIYFGVFAFQIPSRSDIGAVLGRVTWRVEPA